MHKYSYVALALCFFSFILWVIYQANTGQQTVFFQLVAAIPYGDKLGHFCLFGLLTLLVNFSLNFKTLRLGFTQLYLGSVLVSTFVIVEELSQFFIPNRTLDPLDLLADFVGILTFSLLSVYFQKSLEE
ncbi:trypsin [Litorilituus lipolyticus]|uniref:Trypsin n=2 Tax=Litorilituus lipolyticus TaxID=2491017 RepID=A0A502KPK0_9GAMM|nr:trypsin [Litorilituus lipolyticus]